MIRARKIARVAYETPDVEQQTDYYTEVLGLSLIAKERGAVFLSSTLDHHSVVLRKGPEAKCVRIGFQLAPEDGLEAFDRQTAAIGIKVARKSDPEPAISDAVIFEDTKGTLMEVFTRPTADMESTRASRMPPILDGSSRPISKGGPVRTFSILTRKREGQFFNRRRGTLSRGRSRTTAIFSGGLIRCATRTFSLANGTSVVARGDCGGEFIRTEL
jgi:catechol 2,3-dioxygenase-like lactoylglutathione lyase family enzyme